MQFISPLKRQYKANLHLHTKASDGALTAEQAIRLYRENGYDILGITDEIASCPELGSGDCSPLLLTGMEVLFDLEPGKDPRFSRNIRLSLLSKIQKQNQIPSAANGLEEFLRQAKAMDYLVGYQHPCRSMASLEDLKRLDGCYSVEIMDTQGAMDNGFEHMYNLGFYNASLRHGKTWFCHAGDSYRDGLPFDHYLRRQSVCWTQIQPEFFNYDGVIHALENGLFYATNGPVIHCLEIHGGIAHLECSEAYQIMMHTSPKLHRRVMGTKHQGVFEADFEIPETVPYVQFTVFAGDGTCAHTRAYFREEFM